MGCRLSLSSDLSERSSLISSCETSPKVKSRQQRLSEDDTLIRDAELHYQYSGGSRNFGHSIEASNNSVKGKCTDSCNFTESIAKKDEEDRVLGLEESDSGIHSRSSLNSPKRTISSFTGGKPKIRTTRGKDLHNAIKQAYKLKGRYSDPSKEFLREMDKLFMDVQIYLTELSARQNAKTSHKEADALVDELIALRNHWGPRLLPSNVCNAFVRERIQLTVSDVHYRIDCAQFFEPVPFYTSPGTPTSSELMKIYRFSIYEMSRNEVVVRYYLERSNVVQLYHVLCFSWGSERGQVHPFGAECPSYWDIREQMMIDACTRLKEF